MRVVYEWGLDGRVVNGKSYVVTPAGEEKLVYETVIGWNPQKQTPVFRSFSAWGNCYEGSITPNRDAIEAEWNDYAPDKTRQWRQTIRLVGADEYEWTVYSPGENGWTVAKESTFHRVSADGKAGAGAKADEKEAPRADAARVDAARADAARAGVGQSAGVTLHKLGTPEKRLECEVVVPAAREKVWKLWTTRAGLVRFFPADANVDLTVGGPYELYMKADAPEGSRGSEGCKVLAFLAPEMLAFDWNAPPQFPEARRQRTQVVLQFEALGPQQTRVRLTQHGWGAGDEWDQVYEYFAKAWPRVLESLRSTVAS